MKRQRILLAVKDLEIVDELRPVLISSGYEIKLVDNGATALDACREFHPHLLLADLDLPKLDGHHLLREIKSQSATKNIPIILMSRHRSVEERVHSINLGVDDYITTPFEVKEVILRVQIILKEIEKLEASPIQRSKGFSGKLAEMNVVELIQTLEIAKKTCVVSVQHDNDEGFIFLKDGEVLDVSLHNLDAKKALFRMFTWDQGIFHVQIKELEQTKILTENTEELVRQGLIFRDRWDKLAASLPPLQVTVTASPKLSKEEYSQEEQSILNNMNGNSRLVDLIQDSTIDDLKALQIIAKLFYQGSIKEVSVQANFNGIAPAQTNGNKHFVTKDHLTKLVGHFLNQETSTNSRRDYDPESALNRNGLQRRVSDTVLEKNQVYLNKSELLMIREKLSNGKAS